MTLLWLKPKGLHAIRKPFENLLLICVIRAFKVDFQSLRMTDLSRIPYPASRIPHPASRIPHPASRIPPVNIKFIPHFLVETSTFCSAEYSAQFFFLYPVFRSAYPARIFHLSRIPPSLYFDSPESKDNNYKWNWLSS